MGPPVLGFPFTPIRSSILDTGGVEAVYVDMP